ncbi:MAG: UMP kinase [Candidatus Woesearchaeota archaeon]
MLKILSLGGSLIVPNDVDYKFLKGFRELILDFVKKGNKVIIVCGGGSTCRKYYAAMPKITKMSKVDYDWVGVMATRLNAELIRVMFHGTAEKKVMYKANEKYHFSKILIVGGDKPGGSSDLDAVELAKANHANEVINLTDIDYVYNKNPKKYKNAKPYEELTWAEYKTICGGKWVPGMHLPFDPIASQKAMDYGLEVTITNGRDLKNLKKILNGESNIKGTIIG